MKEASGRHCGMPAKKSILRIRKTARRDWPLRLGEGTALDGMALPVASGPWV